MLGGVEKGVRGVLGWAWVGGSRGGVRWGERGRAVLHDRTCMALYQHLYHILASVWALRSLTMLLFPSSLLSEQASI